MQIIAHHDPVKAQIGHVIGRGSVQRARHMGGHVRALGGGGQPEVADLLVRDHQLAAQTCGVELHGGAAQDRQFRRQIRRVQRHIAHHMPAARDAMKQPDAIKGQGKSEVRFHLPLTNIPPRATGVRGDHVLVLQQLSAEGKENTPWRIDLPLALPWLWCSLRHRTARFRARDKGQTDATDA